MKVKVSSKSDCQKELHVEVSAEEVGKEVESFYERLSREVKLPGFRKGKAPLPLVRRQYKEQARKEIVERVVAKYTFKAIEAESLKPVADPRISKLEFEEGRPLVFVADVEIPPTIKLKKYKGHKLSKEKKSVTDAQVEEVLEKLREQRALLEPLAEDRPAAAGDWVLVDFEGTIDEKEFPGSKAQGYAFVIGSGTALRAFEEALIGMRKGEEKEFSLTFPADHAVAQVAGRTARMKVTLKEIKEQKKPVLDDVFAKEVWGIETLLELRRRIREDLEKEAAKREQERLREQLFEKLLEEHTFDVPPTLVLQEQNRILQRVVQGLRAQGLEPNQFSEEKRQEIVENARKNAERSVRWSFLIERIAQEENIACTDQDLEKGIQVLAERTGRPKEDIQAALRREDFRQEVEARIRFEKTLDFLLEQSKMVVKE